MIQHYLLFDCKKQKDRQPCKYQSIVATHYHMHVKIGKHNSFFTLTKATKTCMYVELPCEYANLQALVTSRTYRYPERYLHTQPVKQTTSAFAACGIILELLRPRRLFTAKSFEPAGRTLCKISTPSQQTVAAIAHSKTAIILFFISITVNRKFRVDWLIDQAARHPLYMHPNFPTQDIRISPAWFLEFSDHRYLCITMYSLGQRLNEN